MTADRRMRAAVAGREVVKAQTLWHVELSSVKFRCLSRPQGLAVQQHDGKRWTDMSLVGVKYTGAGDLLIRVANGLIAELNKLLNNEPARSK